MTKIYAKKTGKLKHKRLLTDSRPSWKMSQLRLGKVGRYQLDSPEPNAWHLLLGRRSRNNEFRIRSDLNRSKIRWTKSKRKIKSSSPKTLSVHLFDCLQPRRSPNWNGSRGSGDHKKIKEHSSSMRVATRQYEKRENKIGNWGKIQQRGTVKGNCCSRLLFFLVISHFFSRFILFILTLIVFVRSIPVNF